MTGGKPPLTHHIPISTQPMAGGPSQPSFTENPQKNLGPPQGVFFHQPHQRGTLNPNPEGGIPNPNPFGLHFGQPFLGFMNPTWSPKGQPSFPPQGPNPYPPQGQPSYPPQGKIGYPPQTNQANYAPSGYTSYLS